MRKGLSHLRPLGALARAWAGTLKSARTLKALGSGRASWMRRGRGRLA